MKNIASFVGRKLPAVLAVSGILLSLSLMASAVPVSLGGAADYAILGTGGTVDYSDFEVYQSGTIVNGNIGMGPHSELTHNIDATINGRFDYDLTSTLAGKTTTGVQGSINQIDMSAIVAAARVASATAASFAPTQTFATLSEFQVIVGAAGLNVIRITGDVSLKKGLTIKGNATSQFIFQFTSPTTDGHDVLNLSGMTMTRTGGVLADSILWNLNGLGGGINITSMAPGQTVYGTFLAPDRDILGDHALVDGRLIGGGSNNLLSVHSSSSIDSPQSSGPQPSVPDNGSSLLLISVALGFLGAAKWKFAV